jgi:hypothetical protein
MWLIRDLNIYVHGVPYITTLIVFHNSVLDSNYSMLLGRPWLRDAKVAHDSGSNIITIQGNGIVQTITITKHLGGEVRKPKVLLCYDYQNGITYEKEDIIFVTQPKLFSIKTINFLETIQFMKITNGEIMDLDVKASISKQDFGVQSIRKKVIDNRYEP